MDNIFEEPPQNNHFIHTFYIYIYFLMAMVILARVFFTPNDFFQ